MQNLNRPHVRCIAALILSLILTFTMLSPLCSFAEGAKKEIVRVGWDESPFNHTDSLGRKSGFAYEYQQKIAAYSGWTYEYVEGSWPELLQMLIDGKIDMLSDVSYTEERTSQMLYPSLPIGTEVYYLFVNPNNKEITPDNLSAINGKKVGVEKGSINKEMFIKWASKNGINAEVIDLTCSVEESIEMLDNGKLDVYVSLDAFRDVNHMTPVCMIGSSDFYFAVSRERPELIPELNAALTRIQNEDYYFGQRLNEKYMQTSGSNLYLGADDLEWLSSHGAVRVGYQDNYLAFCAKDPKTGELIGALKEFLLIASDALANVHIDFEPVAYPTVDAAIAAMKKGEVDCVFPANLTAYDGEMQELFITPALMATDMSAIVRISDLEFFSVQDRITVAVNAGNPNYDKFLLDYFPEWRAIYFDTTPDCLKGISEGHADCLLLSNYRYNNVADYCKKYDLTSVSTGVSLDYCFAVNRSDINLYSILSKLTEIVPDSSINSALSYYFTEDAKQSFGDILMQNIGWVIGIPALLIAALFFLLYRGAKSDQKIKATEKLIHATEYDKLTGLYDKNFFNEYAERMYKENPDKKMDAIMLNIENFHSINLINGRSLGDRVLAAIGEEIGKYLLEDSYGIACRTEADYFGIYCAHPVDASSLMERLHNKLDTISVNTNIMLRMGIMPWFEHTEPARQFDQARIAAGLAHNSENENIVIYDDKVREREEFEQRLLGDLRRAVENRELEVHYQPKYYIQSDPPVLESAEALVRWRHPEFGMIPPEDFIPLLERSGGISSVDKYVWSVAAAQIAEWKKRYGITIPISVNLSRVDVFDPTLEMTLDELIEKNGLKPCDLKLEVTESACAETPYKIIDVIKRLRKKGYEIAMDDFGSGYSSLNMLSSMPIDVLKMDRAFVSNIEHEQKDLQLVELILGIAENLGVPVIAEGVETESQLCLLKEKGCAIVQGFYFSRPLPAPDFEARIIDKELSKH